MSKDALTTQEKTHVEHWKKTGEPSSQHKRLAAFEGSWEVTAKWYSAQNAEARESKGTASFKSVYGGRYLEQTLEATVFGDKYEAKGLLGFDSRRNQYFNSWYDNLQTSLVTSYGDWPDGSNELTLNSNHHIDSLTGARDAEGGRVTISVGGPSHTISWYEWDPEGKREYKASEITYTRK